MADTISERQGDAADLLSRRSLWLLFGVCLIELYWVQEITLVAPHSQSLASQVLDRGFRFGLDAMACGALLLLLPRVLLPLIFASTLIYDFALLSYFTYFHRPLSARILVANAGEGAGQFESALRVLHAGHLLILVALAAKLLLLYRAGWRHRPPSWSGTLRRGAALMGGYLVAVAALNFTYKPMKKLATWETVGGVGAVYGYVPTWLAEMTVFDDSTLLTRALDRAKTSQDALAELEAPIEIPDRLVFLQLESTDQALMDFRIGGRPVIPRLEALRATSRVYAVRAEKLTGSCDSDFKALMGCMPSSDVPNYKIAGYPFERSIIRRLNAADFDTVAFHGVSGQFFNRRPAYERMGFDRLMFREELSAAGIPGQGWSILDDRLLKAAADDIRRGGRRFQIVITATSHIPFHHLPDEKGAFFAGSEALEENYFDVMNYVDRSVGDYIDALPPDTLVVIYGDHTSQVVNPAIGYAQVQYEGVGVVPFILHLTGADISGTQRVRGEDALSGRFSLMDAHAFVHDCVRHRFPSIGTMAQVQKSAPGSSL